MRNTKDLCDCWCDKCSDCKTVCIGHPEQPQPETGWEEEFDKIQPDCVFGPSCHCKRLKASNKDFIKQTLAKEKAKMIEEMEGQIKIRKPTHGTCCTCQVCGYDKDDCYCESNFQALYSHIKKLKQSLLKK